MKIIVGLGNPGFRYRATRHNIGFMVLDKIAGDAGIKIKKRLFGSLNGTGKAEGREVMLVKPLTFMNLSGKAVSEVREKRRVSLEDLLIIMDDVDLPLGTIRLKPKGSSGGHKGLRSIIEELKTEEFPRLRVGIGSQEKGFLSDYVLAPFRKDEREILEDVITRCSLCAKAWIREEIEAAMNGFNS